MKKIVLSLLMPWLIGSAGAEIVSSTSDHYVLKHQARSEMPPPELWTRLLQPASWWHPDHTYSGDSANLSLDAQAGGLWREDWDGNSVAHGSVLALQKNNYLRLNAPFGPLQEMAVTAVWTITIEKDGEGSVVTFTETCNGNANSNLKEMATAVDYVKAEAIKRLVSTP